MKTKKELLKFFLESLGLWESFSADLSAQFWIPSWSHIDDDLKNLFDALNLIKQNKNCLILKETVNMLIVDQIKNPKFLQQLISEDVVSEDMFRNAVQKTGDFAELSNINSRLFSINKRTSIFSVVEKVYFSQPMI